MVDPAVCHNGREHEAKVNHTDRIGLKMVGWMDDGGTIFFCIQKFIISNVFNFKLWKLPSLGRSQQNSIRVKTMFE